MGDTTGAAAKISVGKVFSETFALMGRNFAPLAIIGVLFGGIPALISQLALGNLRANPQALADGLPPLFYPIVFLTGFLAFAAQAAATLLVVDDAQGRKRPLGELLTHVAGRLLPLIGLGILMYFGVVFASILLVIPGIIVTLMWCVAPQVLIVRKLGVIASLKQSARLTKGNRWRILGLALIAVAVLLVIGMISGALTFAISGPASPTLLVLSPVISSLQLVVYATAGAALYVELERAKGGGAAVADIFD